MNIELAEVKKEAPLILGLAAGNSTIVPCASRGRWGHPPSAAQLNTDDSEAL